MQTDLQKFVAYICWPINFDQILNSTLFELLQYFSDLPVSKVFRVAFDRHGERTVLRKSQLFDLIAAVAWPAFIASNGQFITKIQTKRDFRGICWVHLLKRDLSGQAEDVENEKSKAAEHQIFVKREHFQREYAIHFRN